MSAQTELQTAIYTVLSAGLSVTVYDHVTDGKKGKYVVIGNDTFIEWDTDGNQGFEATITIHTWDNSSSIRGMKSIQVLQGEIYDLLHKQDLSLTSYDVVSCMQEFSETFMESDGVTRHGVQRFRILMTEV